MPDSKTVTQDIPKMVYLKHTARILLFYFVGLSIFFISGFLVFKILFADTEKAVVPDVVGKLFLGEHNKLRDDFKVEIKTAYLLQYPYGYILAQDVNPGKRVDKMTKLELLVNLSDAVVKVPKVIGFSEDLVEGALSSLPVGGRVFQLRKGSVTRVFSAKPKNEILAQFPPPETPVIPNSPVALLISNGPQPLKPQASLQPKIEKGTPVSIALNAAYYLKKPASITLKPAQKADENATLVTEAKISGDTIQLEVGQFVEELMAKKSPLSLDELPFTELYIPHKKLGGENETLTLARKEKMLNEEGSPYSEFWYIKNNSTLPVFRRQNDEFDIFANHYEPNIASVNAAKEADSKSQTVVGEAPKTETQTEQKPTKTLRLSAASL